MKPWYVNGLLAEPINMQIVPVMSRIKPIARNIRVRQVIIFFRCSVITPIEYAISASVTISDPVNNIGFIKKTINLIQQSQENNVQMVQNTKIKI